MSNNECYCKNCGTYLKDEDEYCQVCGTKKGEGEFNPSKNDPMIVYGPITTKYFKCEKCKHKWSAELIDGILDVKYCPKCGAKI